MVYGIASINSYSSWLLICVQARNQGGSKSGMVKHEVGLLIYFGEA